MGRGAIGAILAALLFAAPASGAGWLSPTVVGQSATADDASPVAASAPDGSAAIAWLATLPGGNHAVRVAVRGPSGAFGAEQSFPEGGTASTLSDVHVAIDAHGDVAVAWIADGVAAVAMRPSGGTFGAPVAIPSNPYGANELALGIDGAGTATVAVAESRSVTDMSCSTVPVRVYLRYVAYPVSVAGAVAPLQTIFNANADCLIDFGSLGAPEIAVNPRGDAVASIQTNSGGYGVRVLSRALSGGAFGNQVNLSNAYQSSVAVAPNGHFVAAGIASSRAVSVAGIAGQAPGATQMLSETPPDASAAGAAIDAGGKGTIAWQATPGADAYRVHARDVLPTGAPGPVLAELSPEVTDSAGLGPRLAVGGPGSAFVVWRSIDGPSGHYEVDASLRAPGADFAAPTRISGDTTQDATQGDVAADDAGGAIAVFRRFDGSSNRIYVAPYDAVAPALTVNAPATATAGEAASFAATATDNWGPVALHWDFGDGSGADGETPSHTFATAGTRTVTVTATDGAGNQATATRDVAVAAPPVPTVSAVRADARRGSASARSATAVTARRAPRGTTIRFSIAVPATATIAFQRPAAGRRSGGRCVKPTRKLRGAKRCTRYVGEGKLTRASLAAGAATVTFSGRVGRRALRRGRHRVVVSAATTLGAKAKGKPARFTIVR